jgi:hypothetical protein
MTSLEGGGDIIALERRGTRIGGGLLEQRADRRVVEARIGSRIPSDAQRIARLARLPEVIGHHDDTARGRQNPTHAW